MVCFIVLEFLFQMYQFSPLFLGKWEILVRSYKLQEKQLQSVEAEVYSKGHVWDLGKEQHN